MRNVVQRIFTTLNHNWLVLLLIPQASVPEDFLNESETMLLDNFLSDEDMLNDALKEFDVLFSYWKQMV